MGTSARQLNEKVKSATTGATLDELITGEVTRNALVDEALDLVVKSRNLAFTIVEEVPLVVRGSRCSCDVFPRPNVFTYNDLEVIPMSLRSVKVILVICFVPEFPRFETGLVVRNRDRTEKLQVFRVVVENRCWEYCVVTDCE